MESKDAVGKPPQAEKIKRKKKQDLVHFCNTGDQPRPINLFPVEKLLQNQQEDSGFTNSHEHGQKVGRE